MSRLPMKTRLLPLLACLLAPAYGQDAATNESASTNLPPDPFGDVAPHVKAADYAMPVDRGRGSFTVAADAGNYVAGSHFATWNWTLKADRWGNFHAGLLYDSMRPKLGVQLKIGDLATLKGYAPRTNPLEKDEPMVMGPVYIPKPGEYPVSLLTGDQSNVPAFQVKAVHFQPAPESEPLGQSIDGSIVLEAKTATTYATTMRYEPKPEKNCLGFWKEKDDWAEWVFDADKPGKFELAIHYGAGDGSTGGRAAVLVNDQTKEFMIESTGGFQNWKELKLGTVEIATEGENRVAIVPLELAGAALMDVSKITLTPVP